MFTTGVKLLNNGNPVAALREFHQSLAGAVGDRRADSLYNIGICHVQLGNTDAALEAITEAVRIDPGLAADIRTDKDFAPIASNALFAEALRFAERDVSAQDRAVDTSVPTTVAAAPNRNLRRFAIGWMVGNLYAAVLGVVGYFNFELPPIVTIVTLMIGMFVVTEATHSVRQKHKGRPRWYALGLLVGWVQGMPVWIVAFFWLFQLLRGALRY